MQQTKTHARITQTRPVRGEEIIDGSQASMLEDAGCKYTVGRGLGEASMMRVPAARPAGCANRGAGINSGVQYCTVCRVMNVVATANGGVRRTCFLGMGNRRSRSKAIFRWTLNHLDAAELSVERSTEIGGFKSQLWA